MKRYRGKREDKYSFWKDAFYFSCFIWMLIIVYIFFAHLSEVSLMKEQEKQMQKKEEETVKLIQTNGSLPGDDVPAEGYASLEAMGFSVEDIYDHSNTFKVTHYCGCSKCCGKWSSGNESDCFGSFGTKLSPYYSIAVDTSIISLGTILWDDEGNYYRAEDTGSAIKGNRIDLFVGDHEEALNLGLNEITLYWND